MEILTKVLNFFLLVVVISGSTTGFWLLMTSLIQDAKKVLKKKKQVYSYEVKVPQKEWARVNKIFFEKEDFIAEQAIKNDLIAERNEIFGWRIDRDNQKFIIQILGD